METQTIDLPIFGKTELENADWEYKYQAHLWAYGFDELVVDLDVHFKEVNSINIEKVSNALNDLKKLNKIGLQIILNDYIDERTTREYIDEWNLDIFEQIFTKDKFDAFILRTDKNKCLEERLLSLIRLVRVGFYAESDDSFVILDYAFGYDMDKGFRDNMLAVKLNANYELCEIIMEG